MKTLAVDGKKQKKATRQRKKSKLNEIRKQIEFYFSDANLSKNRFMKTLLDQSEYVPFTVLMTFNRLKEMSATQEEVVKSLTKSTMVEVSPDEQSLRRTTEIVIKEDADDYTIYIEQIPLSYTIKTLRERFEQFGVVSYVSLPRHRDKHKEYAFIEFLSKKSVRKAIVEYTKYDSVISEDADPMDLMSTKSYLHDPLDYNYQDQDLDIPIHPMPSIRPIKRLMAPPFDISSQAIPRYASYDAQQMLPPHHKDWRNPDYYCFPRKNHHLNDLTRPPHIQHPSHAYAQQMTPRSSSHLTHPIHPILHAPPPLFYTDHTIGESSKSFYEQAKEAPKVSKDYFVKEKIDLDILCDDDSNASSERYAVNSSQEDDNSSEDENKVEAIVPKKIRKRRNAVDCKEPSPLNNLRIMKKKDWKKLRNLYLKCQRDKLKKINKRSKSVTITLPTHSINFYGALQESKETLAAREERLRLERRQKLLDTRPSFSYAPGMIVKVAFQSPCADVKEFKNDMRQYPYVQYVDIQEGGAIAYIRTTSMKFSEELIKNVGTAEIICTKLTGTLEANYWEKIIVDRSNKLTKNIKVDKRKKEATHTAVAPKHVRFD